MQALEQALQLHITTGNIQGQADDTNKISEILVHLGRFNEALTKISDTLSVHVQINDTAGQGDDLYVQGCIFLRKAGLADMWISDQNSAKIPTSKSGLVDAAASLQKALAFHREAGVHFSIAKDLAALGHLYWELYCSHGYDVKHLKEALDLMKESCQIFKLVGAPDELKICESFLEGIEWNCS